MTIGKVVRIGILTVAAAAAGIWAVGSLTSRSSRSFGMTILMPADAELGGGTAVVAGRGTIGTVTQIGELAWGLPLEVRTAARHRTWVPVVLAASESATSGEGASLLRLSLDATDSVFNLSAAGAPDLVLRRDAEGNWLGQAGAGAGRPLVNGDSLVPRGAIRLRAGDILTLGSTDVRLGTFGRFRRAELRFTTRKLCPEHPRSKLFPDSAERERCRVQKLGGAARLEFGGTFGLTKPILKLSPSEGEESTLRQPDPGRLPLAVKRDLQTEVGEILAYLNSPQEARPRPRTHFEYTLAGVNQALGSIDSTTRELRATVRTVQAAIQPGAEGLAPMVLGKSYPAFHAAIEDVARITHPLADSTRTLVEKAGLGPLLARVDTTLDSTEATIRHLRGQVDRLAPRIELAMEGTARTIEGAEGTLVALKAAAEDIQSIKQGAQASKRYVVGGGLVFVVSQVLAGIAALAYLIH